MAPQFEQFCEQSGNRATVTDLVYGLKSPLIQCLHQTRLEARSDVKLEALVQKCVPSHPARLVSMSSYTARLILPSLLLYLFRYRPSIAIAHGATPVSKGV